MAVLDLHASREVCWHAVASNFDGNIGIALPDYLQDPPVSTSTFEQSLKRGD